MKPMQTFARQLAGKSIHNPAMPTHFMWLRPVEQRVTVYHENLVVCATTDAVCVIEVGCDIMAPVLYVPRADVCADIEMTATRTFCPLKGDAAYFNLVGNDGRVVGEEVAWAYVETFDFASGLKDRVAFNPKSFTIETTPL